MGRTLRTTRPLPLPARVAAALGLVLAVAVLRWLLSEAWLLQSYPFTPFLAAVLATAAMFDRPASFTAMASALVVGTWQQPVPLADAHYFIGVGLFVTIGTAIVLTIETLHGSLEQLRRAERSNLLLLREYRHRSRNDLQSLTALLLLRARSAASPDAQAALREAAAHARALAQVHTRLAAAAPGHDETPMVDIREFLVGLVSDLERGAAGNGLRPVALVVSSESRQLSTERGVAVGLIVNECVTNALKYAFPEDRAGVIRVLLTVDADTYSLTVEDDGVGLPAGAEIHSADPTRRMGTRLLQALAAQLKGRFERFSPAGGGTVCVLRFPVAEPPQPHSL